MRVLMIDGLTAPQPKATTDDASSTAVIDVAPQKIAAGSPLELAIELNLPEGYKLNPQAAVTYKVTADKAQTVIAPDALNARDEATTAGNTAKITLPLTAKSGGTTLQVSVWYTYCRDEKSGLCKLGTATWRVPVEIAATANGNVIMLTSPPGK
jgi:hypothetical protein